MFGESQEEEPGVSVCAVVNLAFKIQSKISMILGLDLNPCICILYQAFLGLNNLLLSSDNESQRYGKVLSNEGG